MEDNNVLEFVESISNLINLVELRWNLKGNNLTYSTGETFGAYLPKWNNLISLTLDLSNN